MPDCCRWSGGSTGRSGCRRPGGDEGGRGIGFNRARIGAARQAALGRPVLQDQSARGGGHRRRESGTQRRQAEAGPTGAPGRPAENPAWPLSAPGDRASTERTARVGGGGGVTLPGGSGGEAAAGTAGRTASHRAERFPARGGKAQQERPPRSRSAEAGSELTRGQVSAT